MIVRTSAFFGPWDRYNFVHAVLRDLAAGRRVEASDEVRVSPTYVPDLAHATLDLLIDRAGGIWHLANQGSISWYELAERVAYEARIDTANLVRVRSASALTTLSSERGLLLPSFTNAIERYVRENTIAWEDEPSSRVAA